MDVSKYAFNVCIRGEAKVGKTSLLESLGIEWATQEPKWATQDGVKMRQGVLCMAVRDNNGDCVARLEFNVTKVPVHDEKGNIGCFPCTIKSDLSIIMFDVTSRFTYKNVPNHFRDVMRSTDGNAIVILVANKIDLHEDRKVKMRQTLFHQKKNIPLVQTSALLGFCVADPFVAFVKLKLPLMLFWRGTAAAVTLMCIRKYSNDNLICLLPRDICKLIAHILRRDLLYWNDFVRRTCSFDFPGVMPSFLKVRDEEFWRLAAQDTAAANRPVMNDDDDDDEW